MKNILLRLLFLAALGFLLSPAMASEPPKAVPALSAADLAFLASLATPPAPAPAANRPSGLEKALCSATAYCWDGSSRTCYGDNSVTACVAVDSNCPSQRGYVTCDGATSWCPPCPGGCPAGWCTSEDEQNCAANCYPCNYTFTCNSTYCTDTCRCSFRTCPP